MEAKRGCTGDAGNLEPAKGQLDLEAEQWFTKDRLELFADCLERAPFLWRADHCDCKTRSILGLAYTKLLRTLGEKVRRDSVPRTMALCRVFVGLLREQLLLAANESWSKGEGAETALQRCPPWARRSDGYLQLMPDIYEGLRPSDPLGEADQPTRTELQSNTNVTTPPNDFDDLEAEIDAHVIRKSCSNTTKSPTTHCNSAHKVADIDIDVEKMAPSAINNSTKSNAIAFNGSDQEEGDIDVDLRNFAIDVMESMTLSNDNDFDSDREEDKKTEGEPHTVDATNEIPKSSCNTSDVSVDNKSEEIIRNAAIDSSDVTDDNGSENNIANETSPCVNDDSSVLITSRVDDSFCEKEPEIERFDSVSSTPHEDCDENPENEPYAPSVDYSNIEKETEDNVEDVATALHPDNNSGKDPENKFSAASVGDHHREEDTEINTTDVPRDSYCNDENCDSKNETNDSNVSEELCLGGGHSDNENEKINDNAWKDSNSNDDDYKNKRSPYLDLLLSESDDENKPEDPRTSVNELCNALYRRWPKLTGNMKHWLRSHMRHHTRDSDDIVDLSDDAEHNPKDTSHELKTGDVDDEESKHCDNHEGESDGHEVKSDGLTIEEDVVTVRRSDNINVDIREDQSEGYANDTIENPNNDDENFDSEANDIIMNSPGDDSEVGLSRKLTQSVQNGEKAAIDGVANNEVVRHRIDECADEVIRNKNIGITSKFDALIESFRNEVARSRPSKTAAVSQNALNKTTNIEEIVIDVNGVVPNPESVDRPLDASVPKSKPSNVDGHREEVAQSSKLKILEDFQEINIGNIEMSIQFASDEENATSKVDDTRNAVIDSEDNKNKENSNACRNTDHLTQSKIKINSTGFTSSLRNAIQFESDEEETHSDIHNKRVKKPKRADVREFKTVIVRKRLNKGLSFSEYNNPQRKSNTVRLEKSSNNDKNEVSKVCDTSLRKRARKASDLEDENLVMKHSNKRKEPIVESHKISGKSINIIKVRNKLTKTRRKSRKSNEEHLSSGPGAEKESETNAVRRSSSEDILEERLEKVSNVDEDTTEVSTNRLNTESEEMNRSTECPHPALRNYFSPRHSRRPSNSSSSLEPSYSNKPAPKSVKRKRAVERRVELKDIEEVKQNNPITLTAQVASIRLHEDGSDIKTGCGHDESLNVVSSATPEAGCSRCVAERLAAPSTGNNVQQKNLRNAAAKARNVILSLVKKRHWRPNKTQTSVKTHRKERRKGRNGRMQIEANKISVLKVNSSNAQDDKNSDEREADDLKFDRAIDDLEKQISLSQNQQQKKSSFRSARPGPLSKKILVTQKALNTKRVKQSANANDFAHKPELNSQETIKPKDSLVTTNSNIECITNSMPSTSFDTQDISYEMNLESKATNEVINVEQPADDLEKPMSSLNQQQTASTHSVVSSRPAPLSKKILLAQKTGSTKRAKQSTTADDFAQNQELNSKNSSNAKDVTHAPPVTNNSLANEDWLAKNDTTNVNEGKTKRISENIQFDDDSDWVNFAPDESAPNQSDSDNVPNDDNPADLNNQKVLSIRDNLVKVLDELRKTAADQWLVDPITTLLAAEDIPPKKTVSQSAKRTRSPRTQDASFPSVNEVVVLDDSDSIMKNSEKYTREASKSGTNRFSRSSRRNEKQRSGSPQDITPIIIEDNEPSRKTQKKRPRAASKNTGKGYFESLLHPSEDLCGSDLDEDVMITTVDDSEPSRKTRRKTVLEENITLITIDDDEPSSKTRERRRKAASKNRVKEFGGSPLLTQEDLSDSVQDKDVTPIIIEDHETSRKTRENATKVDRKARVKKLGGSLLLTQDLSDSFLNKDVTPIIIEDHETSRNSRENTTKVAPKIRVKEFGRLSFPTIDDQTDSVPEENVTSRTIEVNESSSEIRENIPKTAKNIGVNKFGLKTLDDTESTNKEDLYFMSISPNKPSVDLPDEPEQNTNPATKPKAKIIIKRSSLFSQKASLPNKDLMLFLDGRQPSPAERPRKDKIAIKIGLTRTLEPSASSNEAQSIPVKKGIMYAPLRPPADLNDSDPEDIPSTFTNDDVDVDDLTNPIPDVSEDIPAPQDAHVEAINARLDADCTLVKLKPVIKPQETQPIAATTSDKKILKRKRKKPQRHPLTPQDLSRYIVTTNVTTPETPPNKQKTLQSPDFCDSDVEPIKAKLAKTVTSSLIDSTAKDQIASSLPIEDLSQTSTQSIPELIDTVNTDSTDCNPISNIGSSDVMQCSEKQSEKETANDWSSPVIVNVMSLASSDSTNKTNAQTKSPKNTLTSMPIITLKRGEPAYVSSNQKVIRSQPTPKGEEACNFPKVIHARGGVPLSFNSTAKSTKVIRVTKLRGHTVRIISVQKISANEHTKATKFSYRMDPKLSQNVPKLVKIKRNVKRHSDPAVSQRNTTDVQKSPVECPSGVNIDRAVDNPSDQNYISDNATKIPESTQECPIDSQVTDSLPVSVMSSPPNTIDQRVIEVTSRCREPLKFRPILPKITLKRAEPVHILPMSEMEDIIPTEAICLPQVSAVAGSVLHVTSMQPDEESGRHLIVSQGELSTQDNVNIPTILPQLIEVSGSEDVLSTNDNQEGLQLVFGEPSSLIKDNATDIPTQSLQGDVSTADLIPLKRFSSTKRRSSINMPVRSVLAGPSSVKDPLYAVCLVDSAKQDNATEPEVEATVDVAHLPPCDGTEEQNEHDTEPLFPWHKPGVPADEWALPKTQPELVVLCVGPAIWQVADCLVVSACAPLPPLLSLWSLMPRTMLLLPSVPAESDEISPPRIDVDGQTYQKLSNTPPKYALLLGVLRNAAACWELVLHDKPVELYCRHTGTRYTVAYEKLDHPPWVSLVGAIEVRDSVLALQRALSVVAAIYYSSASPRPEQNLCHPSSKNNVFATSMDDRGPFSPVPASPSPSPCDQISCLPSSEPDNVLATSLSVCGRSCTPVLGSSSKYSPDKKNCLLSSSEPDNVFATSMPLRGRSCPPSTSSREPSSEYNDLFTSMPLRARSCPPVPSALPSTPDHTSILNNFHAISMPFRGSSCSPTFLESPSRPDSRSSTASTLSAPFPTYIPSPVSSLPSHSCSPIPPTSPASPSPSVSSSTMSAPSESCLPSPVPSPSDHVTIGFSPVTVSCPSPVANVRSSPSPVPAHLSFPSISSLAPVMPPIRPFSPIPTASYPPVSSPAPASPLPSPPRVPDVDFPPISSPAPSPSPVTSPERFEYSPASSPRPESPDIASTDYTEEASLQSDPLTSTIGRPIRTLEELEDVCHMSDEHFVATYRLPKQRVLALIQELRPHVPPLEDEDISPGKKILVCLNFLATGADPDAVGAATGQRVSRATVCGAITQVLEALGRRSVYRRHVRFPETPRQRAEVKHGFYSKFGLTGVLGAMAGVHVPVMAPEPPERYHNGVSHSLNVQLVCDADMRITSVDTGAGGAAPNCAAWAAHPLRALADRLLERGEDVYFVTDATYLPQQTILTPITTAQTPNQRLYAARHRRAHRTIRRCISTLKARWRCLSHGSETTAAAPELCASVVEACAVLHNIAVGVDAPWDEEFEERERELTAALNASQRDSIERYLRSVSASDRARLMKNMSLGRSARRHVVRQLTEQPRRESSDIMTPEFENVIEPRTDPRQPRSRPRHLVSIARRHSVPVETVTLDQTEEISLDAPVTSTRDQNELVETVTLDQSVSGIATTDMSETATRDQNLSETVTRDQNLSESESNLQNVPSSQADSEGATLSANLGQFIEKLQQRRFERSKMLQELAEYASDDST